MDTIKWQIFADAGAPRPLCDGELPAQQLQACISHCGQHEASQRVSGVALAPSVAREARRILHQANETAEFPVPAAELTLFPSEGAGDSTAQDTTLLCRLELQRRGGETVEGEETEPSNWFAWKMARASDYRARGNAAFKQQRLGAARRLYTKVCHSLAGHLLLSVLTLLSLELQALAWLECPSECAFDAGEQAVVAPLQVACRVNLATCLWKLGEMEACVVQCSLALQLDARHVKARYRRGQAYLASKEFDLALDDLAAALELEPGNKLFASSLERARVAKQQFNRRQREMFGKLFP